MDNIVKTQMDQDVDALIAGIVPSKTLPYQKVRTASRPGANTAGHPAAELAGCPRHLVTASVLP